MLQKLSQAHDIPIEIVSQQVLTSPDSIVNSAGKRTPIVSALACSFQDDASLF
jgi:hypothetical protein